MYKALCFVRFVRCRLLLQSALGDVTLCSAFRVYFRVLFSLVLFLLCCSKHHHNTNGGGGGGRRRRPYSLLPFVATKKEHHHPNSSTTARFCRRAQNLLLWSRAFLLEREREKNKAFGVWKEIGDEIKKTAGSFLTSSWRLRHHRRPRRRRSRSEKARSRDERWSPSHPRGG